MDMTKVSTNTDFLTQQKKVFKVLFEEPLTMLQASQHTGVMRTNITWYLRNWLRDGVACIVKRDVDKLTGRKAQFFSTNPEACKFCQTKLFE